MSLTEAMTERSQLLRQEQSAIGSDVFTVSANILRLNVRLICYPPLSDS